MNEEPSQNDLPTVLTFARSFDEPGFVAGEWVFPETGEEGIAALGYWVPHEDVAQWQSALYEHHVLVSFDWTTPSWRRQMRLYEANPSLLHRARLLSVRKVLTTLLRAERFCEGSLGEAFDRGVPQAAMRRLGTIAERMR